MSTPALVTAVYPQTDSLEFDFDYYLKTHMPLVEKRWKPFGLESYYVVDLRGSGSPYAIQVSIVFSTGVDGFHKAAKEDGTEIFADVKNFSNVASVLLLGPIAQKG